MGIIIETDRPLWETVSGASAQRAEHSSEKGWDRDSCCSACSWTHLSSSNEHKETAGTKSNPGHVQLGHILDAKDTKRPKHPTATFEVPGAKTGCWQ